MSFAKLAVNLCCADPDKLIVNVDIERRGKENSWVLWSTSQVLWPKNQSRFVEELCEQEFVLENGVSSPAYTESYNKPH